MSDYWEKLKERAASTKFQLMAVAQITNFLAWRAGSVTTEFFVGGVIGLVVFWMTGQALVDAAKAKNK